MEAVEVSSSIFAMGKHGFYVWSAYGFSIVMIVWSAFASSLGFRKEKVRLLRRYQEEV